VDHPDHVGLIRAGVEGAGRTWADIGAGEGAFTLALADILGTAAVVHAVDRDMAALDRNVRAAARQFPGVDVRAHVADYTMGVSWLAPLDGMLMANSLHFASSRDAALAALLPALRPGGHFVLVEYDADRGNPWVPHPISFQRWAALAPLAGFDAPRLLHRVPSRFLGAIYGACAIRA
jgi:ubiquinone/menaquinone biosynthesis C-methylase UbiE